VHEAADHAPPAQQPLACTGAGQGGGPKGHKQ
jgi:hypothetical protein